MKLIEKSVEIYKTLQEQRATGGRHTIWLSVGDRVCVLDYVLSEVDLERNRVKGFVPKDGLIDSGFYDAEKVMAKVFLKDVGVYFNSHVESYGLDSGVVYVHMPKIMSFKERREEERFRPMGEIKLRISHPKFSRKNFLKDLLDISANGLSIILTKNDAFPFDAGEVIGDGAEILLEGTSKNVTLEVLKIKKIKPFVLENVPYGDRIVSMKFSSSDELALKRWHRTWEEFKKKLD